MNVTTRQSSYVAWTGCDSITLMACSSAAARSTPCLVAFDAALAGHLAYPKSIDRLLGLTARFHVEHFHVGFPGWILHKGF